MAQGKENNGTKKPTHDIYWTLERFGKDGEKKPSSWFRCGAIWPTSDPDIFGIDVSLLNPATGEPVNLRFTAKTAERDQK
jgi:hypothetical protein